METEKSTPFGERLKLARKNAKLTQATAAKRVGMSQGTLAGLESNGQGSSYTPALAALYNVNSVWLATGKGEPQKGQEPLTIDAQFTEHKVAPISDRRRTPSPEIYAEVVLLFGGASDGIREEVLRILKNAAAKSGRLNNVIGDNKLKRGGSNDGNGL